jgi:hypothetical protein
MADTGRDRARRPHGPLHRPEDGSDVDLTGNAAGVGVTHEATRRRRSEGAGADLSWRLGAEAESDVGRMLDDFCAPRWLDRLRGRGSGWRVLHGVPLGDAQGRERGDIDHLLVGPPGLVTINTKHHRNGKVVCDGDQLRVGRHTTPHVPKARREAERVRELVTPAIVAAGLGELAGSLVVSPALVLVALTVQVRSRPSGVMVLRPSELVHPLQTMTRRLGAAELDELFEVARWRSTWVHPPGTRA